MPYIGQFGTDPDYRYRQLDRMAQAMAMVAHGLQQSRERKKREAYGAYDALIKYLPEYPDLVQDVGEDFKKRYGRFLPELDLALKVAAERAPTAKEARAQESSALNALKLWQESADDVREQIDDITRQVSSLPDEVQSPTGGAAFPNILKQQTLQQLQLPEPDLWRLAGEALTPSQRMMAKTRPEAKQFLPKDYDPLTDPDKVTATVEAANRGFLTPEAKRSALRQGGEMLTRAQEVEAEEETGRQAMAEKRLALDKWKTSLEERRVKVSEQEEARKARGEDEAELKKGDVSSLASALVKDSQAPSEERKGLESLLKSAIGTSEREKIKADIKALGDAKPLTQFQARRLAEKLAASVKSGELSVDEVSEAAELALKSYQELQKKMTAAEALARILEKFDR